MENKILISVLVPTYNRHNYLKECLNSVLEQKGFNDNDLEFIISDNSSNNDTKTLLEEYINNNPNKKIIYNKNIENLGMVGNWNKLLEIKTGEYFIFLSDDDKFYDENSLKTLYQNLIKYNVDVCYGERYYIDSNSNFIEELIDRNDTKLKGTSKNFYLLKKNDIYRWNCMGFGGVLFKDINLFFDLKSEEFTDYDFNMEYINKNNKVIFINDSIFLYRLHQSQAMKGISTRKAFFLLKYIFGKTKVPFYKKNYYVFSQLLGHMLINIFGDKIRKLVHFIIKKVNK